MTLIQLLIGKKKAFFDGYFEGNSDAEQFFSAPPHNLVKWLFIDDLYRPSQFTWIFELFTKYSCAKYHMSKDRFDELIGPMTKIALPWVRRNLLLKCLTWPLTLAALVNDREFVNKFKAGINAAIVDEITIKSYPTLVKALHVYVNGGEFILENFKHLEYICKERGHLENLGFPMDKIRTAFEPYIQKFMVKPKFLDDAEDIVEDIFL